MDKGGSCIPTCSFLQVVISDAFLKAWVNDFSTQKKKKFLVNLPILKPCFIYSLNEQVSSMAVMCQSSSKWNLPSRPHLISWGWTLPSFPPWHISHLPGKTPCHCLCLLESSCHVLSSHGWWRQRDTWLAQPTWSQSSASCREMQHTSGRGKAPGWKRPKGWSRLWASHAVLCNNLRIVKCNLVIEIQVIWQQVKILLIINIFNSNRDFPDKDILALTRKTKSISFENHTICLQLFTIVVFPKLFCMSCPRVASIHFFHYRLHDGRQIMLIKFASTKLEGTACTMEDRVRIQNDLNSL